MVRLSTAPVPQPGQSLCVCLYQSHMPKGWQRIQPHPISSQESNRGFQALCAVPSARIKAAVTVASWQTPLGARLTQHLPAGVPTAQPWLRYQLQKLHTSRDCTAQEWALQLGHTQSCENLRKLIKVAPEFQSDSVTFTMFPDSLLDFILPTI